MRDGHRSVLQSNRDQSHYYTALIQINFYELVHNLDSMASHDHAIGRTAVFTSATYLVLSLDLHMAFLLYISTHSGIHIDFVLGYSHLFTFVDWTARKNAFIAWEEWI